MNMFSILAKLSKIKATLSVLVGEENQFKKQDRIQRLHLDKSTLHAYEGDRNRSGKNNSLESGYKFMDWIDKDERDYLSRVRSVEQDIELRLARAF